MKNLFFTIPACVFLLSELHAEGPLLFDTKWIPSKPEMLTYRSTGPQGEGLYQISVWKGDSTFGTYLNIISPGFAKTVVGTMTFDMHPIASASKIIVNEQIVMDTKCSYEIGRLHIFTVMSPYNKIVENSPSFSSRVVDFSQVPLLARTLRLQKGAEYTISMLNPQTNTLIPLTVKVIGEGYIGEIDCYKVELNDFEGQSVYWIEKGIRHRPVRIEQPDAHRITELLQ